MYRSNTGKKNGCQPDQLDVGAGEIYGLLGANGAGKTTTMRMVLGLIYPDSGKILYKGKPYSQEQLSMLGYLPEERGMYPKVKISDQVIYLAQLRGMARKDADRNLKAWLEKFNISEYYNMKIEELSKGNQQKIQFIASVIHDPQILILDEAFSGLDPVNVELLKKTVKELRDGGKTILFSTHRMEHVEELCRNITIMHRSNPVIQGSLKEIKKQFNRERVILGADVPIHGLEGVAGVKKVEELEQGNGYTIWIDREETAQELLHHAMKQTVLTRFELLEPTLNEIFIRSVGESNE